jgi:hypothetical protein
MSQSDIEMTSNTSFPRYNWNCVLSAVKHRMHSQCITVPITRQARDFLKAFSHRNVTVFIQLTMNANIE